MPAGGKLVALKQSEEADRLFAQAQKINMYHALKQRCDRNLQERNRQEKLADMQQKRAQFRRLTAQLDHTLQDQSRKIKS